MSTHPKPTRGIWSPLLSLTVGAVMLAYDLILVPWRRIDELNLGVKGNDCLKRIKLVLLGLLNSLYIQSCRANE